MKLRTSLLIGATFAAGILAGPALRTAAPLLHLSRAYADDAGPAEGPQDTYHLLNLFGEVFERVRADYVAPVRDRELVDNALNGMLTGLDPHSSYMNAKQYKDMQVVTTGKYGGLGLEVTSDEGLVKVISPIDDTPAARAGMKAGDLILSLNGKSVEGLSLNEAVDQMKGDAGTTITLNVKREHIDKPIDVTMTREVIHIQVVKSALYGDVGYIRMSSFNEESDDKLRAAITKLKDQSHGNLHGIVFDLRNNPGGLLDQAVDICEDFIPDGEIVSTRARHPEDSQRWDAKGSRPDRWPASGGADQWRLGLGQRDRGRRVAGPQAGRRRRHPQFWERLGADGHRHGQRWRHPADHGPLLHAVGPLDPGIGDRARRAGPGNA